MKYSFKEHEQNFKDWCQDYKFPYDDQRSMLARDFLRNLDDPNFVPPLFKHQLESLKRVIYSYEILGKKDLLIEVVTGGGKTTIIAGMIAYFLIVHGLQKFLILVPNTIVRSRLKDDFDPESPLFVYDKFKFFFNGHEALTDRLSLHIMEAGKPPTGIRQANIILGNIHQIHQGKISLKIIQENLDKLVIFNDEAHNSKAEKYDDVLNKLRPQRILRLDTTATPDRLDGLHPDSEKILEYGIRQAMHDRIIKRIIVCKPDIEKVKLTYKDVETGKELSSEEVPWEDIENRKITASKYVVSEKPMRQQIAIAKQCLDYQKKCVPLDATGKPQWKPLLFIVSLSIRDAQNIRKVLENEFHLNTLLVTNESEDSEKDEAMEINKSLRDCKYDAVVSVLMLREGWDVKNISVILLFRKFSYKISPTTGKPMSVYGQQVIGRGLRRINPNNKSEWEQCMVVDHPVLKHDWLWEMLDAEQYEGALNPNEIIDEKKIPPVRPIEGGAVEEKPEDVKELRIDLQDVIDGIPDPKGEKVMVIHDWERFLDEYQYHTEKIDVEETVRDIKRRKLASGFNENERFDEEFKFDLTKVQAAQEMDTDELQRVITEDILNICRDALREYDQNPDSRQGIIYKVLTDHIKKRFLFGKSVMDCNDKSALQKLWYVMTEIREVFFDSGLIEGILTNPPVHEESQR